MNLLRFFKNWSLPIAMVSGVLGYFAYTSIPFLDSTHAVALQIATTAQPIFIFCMLFLTFCKVDLKDLRPCRWHLWLLLIQGGAFTLIGGLLALFPDMPGRVILEGAMICLICPTATAGAVVTRKLGGSAANITTYTILINLLASVLIPLLIPIVHPHEGMDFYHSFLLILAKVFPLLLLPFIAALLVRYLLPPLHKFLVKYSDLSFYIWAVALMLAIAVTVRSIMHSPVSWWQEAGLAAVSLACCALQFIVGRKIGRKHNDPISAAQSLGQKNTVLAIWVGYTFFTPITAVAGGFYSVWHNVYNSYQLYMQRKKEENAG